MSSFSTSDKTEGIKLRLGEGLAGIEPMTQIQAFDNVCAKFGDKPALHQKVIAPVSRSRI